MEKIIGIQAEFDRLFPSEDSCIAYLNRLRWPDGFVCPRCGWREAWQIQPFKYKCKRPGCAYQVTPTAGTIFHRSHIPLRQWFLGAWYTAIFGPKAFTIEQLQELVGLGSIHTALRMRHALGAYVPVRIKPLVMTDANCLPLQGSVEISGCVLRYQGEKAYIIFAQDGGSGKARFYAQIKTSFNVMRLVDFVKENISPGSELSIDSDKFRPIDSINHHLARSYSVQYGSELRNLPASNTAKRLEKEWVRNCNSAKKYPLEEFLANYPNRQPDPNGYYYNFMLFMVQLVN